MPAEQPRTPTGVCDTKAFEVDECNIRIDKAMAENVSRISPMVMNAEWSCCCLFTNDLQNTDFDVRTEPITRDVECDVECDVEGIAKSDDFDGSLRMRMRARCDVTFFVFRCDGQHQNKKPGTRYLDDTFSDPQNNYQK